MLTRKHFNKIAELLERDEVTHESVEEWAEWLATENPAFDYERFRVACGVSYTKEK